MFPPSSFLLLTEWQFIIVLENRVQGWVSQRNSNNIYRLMFFSSAFHFYCINSGQSEIQNPNKKICSFITPVEAKSFDNYPEMMKGDFIWVFSIQNEHVKFHEIKSSQWLRKWMPQGCLETCGNMMAIQ